MVEKTYDLEQCQAIEQRFEGFEQVCCRLLIPVIIYRQTKKAYLVPYSFDLICQEASLRDGVMSVSYEPILMR